MDVKKDDPIQITWETQACHMIPHDLDSNLFFVKNFCYAVQQIVYCIFVSVPKTPPFTSEYFQCQWMTYYMVLNEVKSIYEAAAPHLLSVFVIQCFVVIVKLTTHQDNSPIAGD